MPGIEDTRTKYIDKWNGFSLMLPKNWRCEAIGEIVLVFEPEEWDPSVMIWPMTMSAPTPVVDLARSVVSEIARTDPSFTAWISPEGPKGSEEKERLVVFHRKNISNSGLLKGMLRVCGLEEKKAIVTGIQAPESLFAEKSGLLQTIIASFEITRCIPREQFVEPYERAFSFLYPRGWQANGIVDRTKIPGGGGTISWSTEDANTRSKVYNDGVILDMWYYPSGGFNNPAAQMMMSNPMTAWKIQPFMSAKDITETVVYQLVKQMRPDVILEKAVNDPGLERLFRAMFRPLEQLPGSQVELSAGLAYSTYTEGGVKFKECSVICNWMIPMGADMMGIMDTGHSWFCSIGPTFRAPYEGFDEMAPLLKGIASSYKPDPNWERKEAAAAGQKIVRDRLNAEQQRASILNRTLDHIHRIDQEITESRNATKDEIARINYNTLLGKEDVLNNEGFSFKVDTGYDQYWNKDDSIIGSNSIELDDHLSANGWKQMKTF